MRYDLRTSDREGAAVGNTDPSTGGQTNQNLWPLLREYSEKKKKLCIDEAGPEMMTWGWSLWGVYSLIRWHKRYGDEVGKVDAFLAGSQPGPKEGSIGGPCIGSPCGTTNPQWCKGVC